MLIEMQCAAKALNLFSPMRVVEVRIVAADRCAPVLDRPEASR
jgi:hypothetical protein